ncbi:MAG: hypothetical protein ACTHJQ_25900 [Rhizobiaceae bacterium]
MVQIPDASLIDRVSPRSGRALVSGPSVNTGTGLQELGSDLGQASVNLEDAAKRQTALDGVAADGNASKDLNDFERTFDTRTDYGDFGSSFNDGAREIRDRYASQIADPRARQIWVDNFNKRALSSRSRILDRGVAGQRDERIAGAKSGLEGYQSVIADTGASEEARAEARKNADASIAALQTHGDLSAQEAETWRKNVIEGGDFVYGQRQIEADPSVLVGKTGPLADRIIGVESGGNANAKNPNSSASGAGQFLDSTWLAMVKKYRPDLADGKSAGQILALKGDRSLAREMVGDYAKENSDFLTNEGLQPTDGNVYLAHFLGPRGAAQVLKADPNTPVVNIVGQDVVNANPFLKGMSASQVAAWADKKIGGKLPDWYTSQPADRQLQLERLAQTRSNQLQVEARGNLQDVIQNAPVAVQNTGVYTGNMPGQDQFIAAYGPQEGQQKYDAFQMAVQTGRDIFDMKTMPLTDIEQMVGSARPTSSGDDAALQQKRYEAISSAAETTKKARESDPVTYVQQSFPSVQRAWQDVAQGGGSVSAAIAATTAAEQQLGIRNIQVMPKDIAKQSVEQFKKPDLSDDDRFGAITSLVFSTNDPSQRRAVFNQLVDAGLPPMLEGAVEAYSRGDEGAARRLMQAAIVKPEDLPKNSTTTPATISDTIYSNVWSDGAIGDVAYGLSYGDASSLERAQRGTDLMNRAVRLRMAQGEDLQTAVDNAKKDLFGDVSIYDGGSGVNAELAVPSDTDTNVLTRGLNQAKSDFALALTDQRDRLAGQMKASAAPAGHFSGLLEGGNIDLAARPVVKNADGSISTVRSMSFEEDGKEVLVPTVSPDGKILSDQDAIDLYHRTGQFLGKFDTADNADTYAQALHQAQARFYANRTSNGGKAVLDAATQNRMNDVIHNGIFVSVRNGIGLRDPYTGQFVTDVDGKTPLSIPLDEILKMGKAAPASRGEGEFDRTKASGVYKTGMNQIEGWTGQ